MTRQEFIKYCSAGICGLAGGWFAYSWLNLADEAALRKDYKLQYVQGLSQIELEILYLASLAPSGHNAQPWQITIKNPQHWVIGSVRERWLPAVDPENRELVLSIGAFVENLVLAAGSFGYAVQLDIVAKDSRSAELVEVRLTPSRVSALSVQAIRSRRTIRKNLQTITMKNEDVDYLVGNEQNRISYYPLHSSLGNYLSQATLMANQAQIARDEVQSELAQWIRWSDQQARQYGTGLTPESMEMKGLVRWAAKQVFNEDTVMSKTFRGETFKLVQEQVKECAGWLLIRSEGSAVPDLLAAGRALQASWLRACEKSIAFHPMTQLLEETAWKTELAEKVGHDDVQFIVRVGYINHYPQPVSLRLPLSKIIIV